MLRSQQKKLLAQQYERKKIGKIALKVFWGHIIIMALATLIGSYKPVTYLALGKMSSQKMARHKKHKNFVVEFQQPAPHTYKPVSAPIKIKNPVKKPDASTIIKNIPAIKIIKAEPKIEVTKSNPGKKEVIKKDTLKKEPVNAPAITASQKQKTEIPVLEKSEKVEKASAAQITPTEQIASEKIETEPIVEAIQNSVNQEETLDLTLLRTEEYAQTETNSPMHEIAAVIAERWYRAKGMPKEFYAEVEFVINHQGKAAHIVIIKSHANLIYQAHVKESLRTCDFPKKYYNRKCRIVLKF